MADPRTPPLPIIGPKNGAFFGVCAGIVELLLGDRGLPKVVIETRG